jgi:hypothetical protein
VYCFLVIDNSKIFLSLSEALLVQVQLSVRFAHSKIIFQVSVEVKILLLSKPKFKHFISEILLKLVQKSIFLSKL